MRIQTPLALSVLIATTISFCAAGSNSAFAQPQAQGESDPSLLKRHAPTDSDAAVELKEFHGQGISVKYPAGWEVISDVPEPRVFHVKTLGGKVNASVTVQDLPDDTSLDEYKDATTRDIAEEAGQIHPEKLSEETTHLGEMPAWKLVYSIKVPDSKPASSAKQTLFVAVKDGRGYLLCCTAFDALPGKFDGVFRSMADSMKVDLGAAKAAPAADAPN
jgi:hypothetical protein